MIYILLIIVGIIAFNYLLFNERDNTINLVCGAPKTCKSAYSLTKARGRYIRELIRYYYKKYFLRFILLWNYKKYKNLEKPLFYSTISTNFKYCTFIEDIFTLNARVPNKSVLFMDELSLYFDSMSVDDKVLNKKLKYFIKLFGHITKNGSFYANTHDLKDLHYNIKRCIGNYIYIDKKINILVGTIATIRYKQSTSDDISVDMLDKDGKPMIKKVFFSNSIFRKYDSTEFYKLVEYKPISSTYGLKLKERNKLKK